MIMKEALYTIIVHSENIAGVLNKVTAAFTRRQINIESLNVSASSIKGVHKYTITSRTDATNIERIVQQIAKNIDVIQAQYFLDSEVIHREVAMYKLSTDILQSQPAISKIIRKYSAHIIEVNEVFSILEMSGVDEEITALYEELKVFSTILQFVRSGRIVITTSSFEHVDEFLESRDKAHKLSRESCWSKDE